MEQHPNVIRVQAALRAGGCPAQIVLLPEAAPTAASAAAQLGVGVGQIANSLVFLADGIPLLVLTSGAHRVDTALVGAALGVKIARADADAVRAATGQPIGGVAPVGHPAPVRTLVDQALDEYAMVWAAAGIPQSVFPTSYSELLRLTRGSPAVVA
ncbi:MAG TPA: YbaK/EbsC family protein [Mycobacteriales bacterium]|nr:YbaK/EbsC family protein [Mycobacteriales bacterium]